MVHIHTHVVEIYIYALLSPVVAHVDVNLPGWSREKSNRIAHGAASANLLHPHYTSQ